MASEAVTRELLKIRGSLFGFVLALVRDFNLAEDLFQEVSVRILEHEAEFRPGTNFGAWAREFARRVILEDQRRRARCRLVPEAIEAVSAGYREIDERESERRQALHECLTRLGEAARRLVELRYARGLSMEDIGRTTGRKAGAAQVAISRARSWLLNCVQSSLAEGAVQ